MTVSVLSRARVSRASRSGLNFWRGRLRPLTPMIDDETDGRTENRREFEIDIDNSLVRGHGRESEPIR